MKIQTDWVEDKDSILQDFIIAAYHRVRNQAYLQILFPAGSPHQHSVKE